MYMLLYMYMLLNTESIVFSSVPLNNLNSSHMCQMTIISKLLLSK